MGLKQDFTADDAVFVGEDQTLQWSTYDEQTGLAKDISGFTIQFKMSATQGGAAVLTKSCSLSSPTAGIFQAALSATDLTLAAATYYYAATRTDAGNVQVLAYGVVVLQARPT